MLLQHACADPDDAADANINYNASTNLNGAAKVNGTANVNGTAAKMTELTLREAKGSSPLLPNLGVGSMLGYFTDILVRGRPPSSVFHSPFLYDCWLAWSYGVDGMADVRSCPSANR